MFRKYILSCLSLAFWGFFLCCSGDTLPVVSAHTVESSTHGGHVSHEEEHTTCEMHQIPVLAHVQGTQDYGSIQHAIHVPVYFFEEGYWGKKYMYRQPPLSITDPPIVPLGHYAMIQTVRLLL